MRGAWPGVLVLAALLGLAGPAHTWGNGAAGNPDFPSYGVHDAIAHLAYEHLRAARPEAARWIGHWFLDDPGGYGGGFNLLNTRPAGSDNFLGYTDDPDSVLQDWCNHLYLVHPRPGHEERCAPARAEELVGQLALNLTLHRAAGQAPCNPFEHQAAYNAGLLAHYVGDLSQWGHTDYTLKDHSHPADDPADRTYHGYYESIAWGTTGLRALLADQRARPWQPDRVDDPEAAVAALAVQVSKPDGRAVAYRDRDGSTVTLGSQHHAMLTGFVAAYDARQSHLGMRGFTPDLWARSNANVALAVDLLADLYWEAWSRAAASVPAAPPAPLPGPPGCPAA